jgi:hypothetical protein
MEPNIQILRTKARILNNYEFVFVDTVDDIGNEVVEYFTNNLDDFIDSSSDDDDLLVKKRKRDGRTKKLDFSTTAWGLMLADESINDSSSRNGKLFRRRFRIPYPLFNEILVPLCKEKNIFEIKQECRVRIPLEFKILLCLRILGRGNCCDDIAEMGNMFESSVLKIFKQFVKGMTNKCFDDYVKLASGVKRDLVLETYRKLGFPGALGSMDATHVKWDMCPIQYTKLCKGKEPSLLLNEYYLQYP